MAKDHGSSVKNDKQYEGLRKKGMSKSRAAAISNANAGSDNAASKKGGKKSGTTRQRDPNAACSICEFVTVPPHDGRLHRSQGKSKKPFTAKELDELGLKKR